MAVARLEIDLDAVCANWRALDAASGAGVETAACVKADAYGLGVDQVAPALAAAGVTTFFVAQAEEGAALRGLLGGGPRIAVFSGHMAGDTDMIAGAGLIPMLNSPDQVDRHLAALPEATFGVQLDTGMNRLGMEPAEWDAQRDRVMAADPWLVMSHLACADDPDHPQNESQLAAFHAMTDGLPVRRSLAATGGTLLGPAYHFDMTRPGIGLYGGFPYTDAAPVAGLRIPVIQCRNVAPGESVGYGATWVAERPSRIATIQAGYADGLIRAMSSRGHLYAGATTCPIVGRVSMDMIGVDVTHLGADPDALDILGPHQGVDALAEAAGTIGYEILTSLGARYRRRFHRNAA